MEREREEWGGEGERDRERCQLISKFLSTSSMNPGSLEPCPQHTEGHGAVAPPGKKRDFIRQRASP